MTQLINPRKFTQTVGLLRSFFLNRGFEEVHTQNRLSILAACEEPENVFTISTDEGTPEQSLNLVIEKYKEFCLVSHKKSNYAH